MNLINSNKILLIGNIILFAAICFQVDFSKKNSNKNDSINIETLPPEIPKFLNREEAKSTITDKDGREFLNWLADDAREGRMSGKKGNIQSADWIESKFKSYNLQTIRQKFNIQNLNPGPNNEIGTGYTENIIGIIAGKSDRQIIIGGHMDHIGYGPSMSRSRTRNEIHNGADDNASGTTSVIELAEAFSKMEKPNHTLVFICFSAEELGLIGSRYYVSKLSKDDKNKIDLMVNFDMVGWLKQQKSIKLSGVQRIPELLNIISTLNNKYPFSVIAGNDSSGGSDHAPFGNAGIPYAFFHTGLHDHYHKPSDDVDKIDFEGLTLINQFAFEMIDLFDKSDLHRVSSIDYPELNETIHDHGHNEVPFPRNQ